jgi:hypothetical protein
MTKFDNENSYAKSGKNITKYPLQMDNKNYGVKRKAQVHNVVLKNSKTGQVFGYKTITEMTFTDYLITEADKSADTRLPSSVVGEISGLVKKGAKDLAQAWKNAVELVHTAYHVANVKRPTPDQKGAWKQYEDLLRDGVKALADTRGLSGNWRLSKTAFAEGIQTPELDEVLTEASAGRDRKHRIFVQVRHIGFDDETTEHEVDAKDMDEVIHSLRHQYQLKGRHLHIKPLSHNQVQLTAHVKGASGKTRDETIIKIKDWSL